MTLPIPACRPERLLYPRVLRLDPVAGEGVFERTERRRGRADWTVADYREAGRAEFDRKRLTDQEPMHASMREEYARVFVKLNCPPAKLRAYRDQRNAEFS